MMLEEDARIETQLVRAMCGGYNLGNSIADIIAKPSCFKPPMQDLDFQEMLESIHRNVARSFRRTETYASSFDALTQCYLENTKFARDVSVR